MELHGLGLITEVHLWRFKKKNDTEGVLNSAWIKRKAQEHSFIRLFQPPSSQGFKPYYQYYAHNVSKNDVIIKVDDDIVWVNVSEFRCFVKFVHESVDILLVSANVVNNGVIAHLQQILGIIPHSLWFFEYPAGGRAGRLYGNPSKALELHKYFLSHQEDFYREEIVQFKERISINFIGFRASNAPKMLELVRHVYDNKHVFTGALDETALTTYGNTLPGITEVIYMRLVVAHASFVAQWTRGPKTHDEIVQLYAKERD